MNSIAAFIGDFSAVLGNARKQLPTMFALFLLAAFIDLCGLGMILPLITAITLPKAKTLDINLPFMAGIGAVDLKLLVVGVVVIYVLRAVIAYWVQRAIARFSEGQRGQLMTRLLDAYLHKPYEFHLERNSAVLINNTLNLTWGYSVGVLSALLRLATDVVTFIAILGFLAWTQWQVVLVATCTLVAVLAAYNRLAKKTFRQSGEVVAVSQANAVRVLNHALGALREVRILGIEQHALTEMRYHAQRLAHASGGAAAISALPRYLIETSLIILLASLAMLVQQGVISSANLIPSLGLFAIAAIRLMPGTTSIIGSINSLRSNRYALRQLAEDLKVAESDPQSLMLPVQKTTLKSNNLKNVSDGESGKILHQSIEIENNDAAFHGFKTIELANVTYSYPAASQPALNNFNLIIRSGQAIGIIGRSGAGKSTLADIILGLIRPQLGQVLVDGVDVHQNIRAWMNQLAYIPQTVFIKDATLRENIAFGVSPEHMNESQLQAALVASQLQETVKGLSEGLDTMLGERGIRLSGGQRQRVALARALYHDRQIIIMDEATAALDSETEEEVIRAIQTLHGKKTLIIVAHRHSTLAGCDFIVKLHSLLIKNSN